MSRILLQTTIAKHPDDWDIARYSLLAGELRASGHQVIARNRVDGGGDDPVLSNVDELGKDYVRNLATWLHPATSRPTPRGQRDERIPAHQ
jgi:hypothetical protein